MSLEDILKSIPEKNRHLLDTKLNDAKKRYKIAKSLPAQWQTVANYIPNVQDDISGIEHDNNGLDLQRMGLLDKWLERNGPFATYRQLAECLYEAGAMNTLHVLCKELGASEQSATPVHSTPVPPQAPPQAPSQAPHQAPPPAPPHITPHQIPHCAEARVSPHPPAEALSLPEPTIRELANLVNTDRPYDLGVQLNLTRESLNLMRANFPNNHARQRQEVFDLYLRQSEEPSWVEVAGALEAMGEINNAKRIRDKFGFRIRTSESIECPSHGQATVPASSSPYPTKMSLAKTLDTDSELRHRKPPTPEEPAKPNKHPESQRKEAVNWKYCRLVIGVSTLIIIISAIMTVVAYNLSSQIQTPYTDSEPSPSKNSKSDVKQVQKTPLARDWLKKEPCMKLLSLITYKDDNGDNASFQLINEIQNDCGPIGTQLGIEDATIRGIQDGHRHDRADACRQILLQWINRGEEVTWERLLQVLRDLKLRRVANRLETALNLHFK